MMHPEALCWTKWFTRQFNGKVDP